MEEHIKNNNIQEDGIEPETAEQTSEDSRIDAEAPAEFNPGTEEYENAEMPQDEYYGDPAQYGYDPRYEQQYSQGGYYTNNNPQYENPYYGQQNMDPRYAQQYGGPYYGQQNMDPRYAQQYGDPYYGQQNMDPRHAQQYGYYGQQDQNYGGQYYPPQGGWGYDPRQNPQAGPAYQRDDRYGQGQPNGYYGQPYGDEEYPEEDYEEDYEEAPRKKKKRSGFSRWLRNLSRKLSRVPTRTLLLIGGGIILLLIAIILLVVLLPKNPGKSPDPVVAPSDTPAAVEETPDEVTPTPEIVVTPTPHPLATPLEFGMTGDIVAEIQQRLIDLGYMDYPVVDGVQQVTTVYGKTTKNAIRTFQSKNGLDTDGNCGPLTYDALFSDDAKAFYIERNDEGAAVKKMQEALISLGYLKASATGYCGQSTVDAIIAFQRANNIEADGKAGAETLKLLYSGTAIAANAASSNTATNAPTETPAP